MSDLTISRSRRKLRVTALTALAALVAGIGVSSALPAQAADITAYDAVNQFIGTENDRDVNKGNSAYGNTYPGATLPFGMVQYNPTTFNTQANPMNGGGYEYEADQLRGFGLTRLSGTGCINNNGAFDFPVLPYTGDLTLSDGLPTSPADDIKSYYLPFSHDNEVSKPGDYSVDLDNGTDVNLTATPRTGVATFDFPEDKGSSTLVFDVAGSNNSTSASEVHIDGNRIYGQTTTRTVCDGGNYTIYFSATFDKPITTSGTWTGSTVTTGSTDASSTTKHGSGAFVSFAKGATVTAKTGISYVSAANAELNATTETADKTAAEVRADAKATWSDALGRVDVTGGTADERTKFYTALYHSLIHPNLYDDVNGEYFGYDKKLHTVEAGRHQYATYSGWDMYRGQAQLIAMAFPEVGSDIAQSIVDLVTQTGDWPNWPHNGTSQQKMTGDGLQVVLTELDAFGSTDYDREAALASLVKTRSLPSSSGNRSNLSQYVGLGFIENRNGSATSTTLEYAITDFAVSQMADRMGDDKNAAVFQARAQSWRNIFDAEGGDIRPRERTGFDKGMNLGNRDDGAGRNQFDQSTGYQYGWLVPQNMDGLIAARGGKDAVTADLNEFFTELDRGVYDTKFAYLSNEGDFQTPWIYNWLQQPAKTTDVLDRATKEMFDTTSKGLPGNDDLGALSSWYVWANIGMYPSIYGTAELSLSSPMFEHVEINRGSADTAISIDAAGATSGNRYIQSMTLDGAATTASWVDENVALGGGTIDYTMGASAGAAWGTGTADTPPSYNDAADVYNNIGTTTAAASNAGMLDATFHSLPREELATVGAAPGQKIPFTGTDITFAWPDTNPGAPDNWIPHGQVIEMDDVPAASISFLGLATNGPSQGDATVVYTDGTKKTVPLQFTDWTPGTNYLYGNVPLVTVSGRNVGNAGKDATVAKVFATVPVALDTTKTVKQVILPTVVPTGIMHVFDVAFGSVIAGPDTTPERIVLSPTETPATSQFVTWRTRAAAGAVEYRVAGTETAKTADAVVVDSKTGDKGDMTNLTATMSDLTPATKYEYRVSGDETWSDWTAFSTASSKADPFTFLYYGDAQEGLTDAWPAILKAANTAHPDSRASIYAGDLVNNATQSEWTQWFSAVSKYGQTQQNFNVIGNHQYNSGNDLLTIDTDSFEYPDNGPRAADAGKNAIVWGDHLEKIMKDNVYYSDYQGVRFITLNANRDNICAQIRPAGMSDADFNCDEGRKIWIATQAAWLERILKDNPNQWTVITQHQPVYSLSTGRNEADIREAWVPIFEKYNVDLVLAGHDHTYGRGYNDADKTVHEGVTSGPVYAVADAGSKFYDFETDENNIWTKNGATIVKKAVQTSTYQAITVEGGTLHYESTIAWVGDDRAAGAIGDTLDSFTITKNAEAGTKWVTEKGVDVPKDTLTSKVPTISGAVAVGKTVTADAGAWSPEPVALSYQWYANGTALTKSATAAKYVVAASLKGKKLTVKVTGAKVGYESVTTESEPTVAVAAGTIVSKTPTITGTKKVGKKLTAHPGNWGSGVKFTYRWYGNGKAISKATKSTYTVAKSLRGDKVTVKVAGRKTGYTTVKKTSGAIRIAK